MTTNYAMHVREHAVPRALQTEITGILFLKTNDVSLEHLFELGSHDVLTYKKRRIMTKKEKTIGRNRERKKG